jgi:hypothetical protein
MHALMAHALTLEPLAHADSKHQVHVRIQQM